MTEPMTVEQALRELISQYWDCAYREGQQGRTNDTKHGDAQRIWHGIDTGLATLAAQVEALRRDAVTTELEVREAWKQAARWREQAEAVRGDAEDARRYRYLITPDRPEGEPHIHFAIVDECFVAVGRVSADAKIDAHLAAREGK